MHRLPQASRLGKVLETVAALACFGSALLFSQSPSTHTFRSTLQVGIYQYRSKAAGIRIGDALGNCYCGYPGAQLQTRNN